MPVRRGEDWGRAAPLPDGGVVVRSDAELAALIGTAGPAGGPPVAGLLGGDLCRTVGGRGDAGRLHGDAARTLPVDAGLAVLDGVERRFVAHLVAGRWWRGRLVVVANAAFVGGRNLAPRAHPGDGRLDLLDAELPVGDRLKAWRRLRTATHVPHPRISEGRVRTAELRFARPAPVRLDGVPAGRARRIVVTVLPDALEVVV